MMAYKFLATGGTGWFSNQRWPLPQGTQAGDWIEAAPGSLEPCRNGVHACEPLDLVYWISDELWKVELAGEQVAGPQALVARRGRLVQRIDAWTATSAAEFARLCVHRAQEFVANLSGDAAESGAQYLATAHSSCASGGYGVAAYASAMAFTLLEPSAAQAFRAERIEQGRLLMQVLGL